MPITIPDELPARQSLEEEGLIVMSENDAVHQDIRPLRIALLNLMPQKEKTETQLARLLGSTPLQVELTLLTTASYIPTNTSQKHMATFYRTWEGISSECFDGLIITGAPIEKLPFEEVLYWKELTEVIEWSQTHVFQTLNLCWAAQASLYHFHGVPKHLLDGKMFGVFPHRVKAPNSPLMRGFNDVFPVPVSRHTEVRGTDLANLPDLEILAESEEAGLCLIHDHAHRHLHMFNHLEYDARTLKDEYERDVTAGDEIGLPKHYFPGDDPEADPRNNWRAHGHLFIANWINAIYQSTPFDLGRLQFPNSQGNSGASS
jgi:homoserine O-succinyltransferase